MSNKYNAGDGFRSMKSTTLFKTLNFELFVKPNLVIMAIGSAAMLGCMGYIAYIRYTYEGSGYYAAVSEDGSEQYVKKQSKWS